MFAGSAAAKTGKAGAVGGTLNVDLSTDVDYTDPALDYLSTGWEIEYATCLKLMNYPDANGAEGLAAVSGGRNRLPEGLEQREDLRLHGQRRLHEVLERPGRHGRELQGRVRPRRRPEDAVACTAVLLGRRRLRTSRPVSGVKVKGSHLIFNLTKAAPDFLARTAMPFFCAIPTNLAHDPNGVLRASVGGPVLHLGSQTNKSITIKKNPNYKGKRPHNVNQITYNIGNSLDASYLRAQQGSTDYAASGIPPASYAEAAQKYGVNKGQFWVKPQLGVTYLAFNHDRPLFQGANGTDLAKAINYAIDRVALLAQSGYLAGKRTDQILPPGIAGFRDAEPVPAQGTGPRHGQEVRGEDRHRGRHLGRVLHLEPRRSSAGGADRSVQPEADRPEREQPPVRPRGADRQGRHRGEPFDITSEGWIADYADPYDFINVLLSGDSLHASNNNNVAYFNDPTYNKQKQY